jgi:dihydroorotase
MKHILIQNATLVNEGSIRSVDVLIEGDFIATIAEAHSLIPTPETQVIDATGLHLLPGLIDDQVHFREPGLTHKGDLSTESRAAVAGGVTSYMEMPNTSPAATTVELLEQKYARAAEVSPANYSFFMGTTNDNLEELLKVDPRVICGVKIFMGSSTGNLLVDDAKALDQIFARVKTLIAVHCECDAVIKENLQAYIAEHGENVPPAAHPVIRSAQACYDSSSFAVELAKKHNTRLHILHISTEIETHLFQNDVPLSEKRITSEACTHHLWFTDEDYADRGNAIKWNPSVKSQRDRDAVRQAVIDGRIDVIATDHAPHTLEEKSNPYAKAPSGGPLVQHTLSALLELVHQGVFTLELVVQKTAHNVADMFQIDRRGYVREGYYADLVLVDLNAPYTVQKDGLLYKCGWSPFEGVTFQSRVISTFVNGDRVYHDGKLDIQRSGMRLHFNR